MKGIHKNSFRLTRSDVRKYVVAEIFVLLSLMIAGIPFLFLSKLVRICAFSYMFCILITVCSKLPHIFIHNGNDLLLEINESGILMVFHFNKKPPKKTFFPWNQIANYSVAAVPDAPPPKWTINPLYDPRDMSTVIVIEDIRGGRFYLELSKENRKKMNTPYLFLLIKLRYTLQKYSCQRVERRRIDDYDRSQIWKLCKIIKK